MNKTSTNNLLLKKQEKNLRRKRSLILEEKSGITLIALVVTIVVLLILAGISISIVLGEGEIIDSARKAGELTNAAIANEQQMLQNVVDWVDEYLGGNAPTLESLVGQVEKNDNIVLKDKNGKSEIVIPALYKVVGPDQDETIDYGDDRIPQIDEGVVIQDDAGNQFVWVPVEDVNTMYETINEDGVERKIGKLYDYSGSGAPDYKEPTLRNYTKDSGYREPDVLTDATNGGDASTEENKGLKLMQKAGVLKNSNNYSTWEVVEPIWKKQLQDEFGAMIESVGAYGGFYIGRYETENLKSQEEKPIVQKNQIDNISNVNWYWMYKNSKKIADENNPKVESSMIWGSQWDAVMNWFFSSEDEETKKYVTDSSGMGWYSDNSNKEVKATGTPINGNNGEVKNRVKNIYDMAGNVWEWTLEATNADYRVHRGGFYYGSGSNYPASLRSTLPLSFPFR